MNRACFTFGKSEVIGERQSPRPPPGCPPLAPHFKERGTLGTVIMLLICGNANYFVMHSPGGTLYFSIRRTSTIEFQNFETILLHILDYYFRKMSLNVTTLAIMSPFYNLHLSCNLQNPNMKFVKSQTPNIDTYPL